METPSPDVLLRDLARRAMEARGLAAEFTPAALAETAALREPAKTGETATRDLRSLLWCSIDNDDSRDLDQLSAAEPLPDGKIKLLVAIADVSALVRAGSAIDAHARRNTTSVYTAAQIFPMLPERLSTDLTSLNRDEDRLAIVVELHVRSDGQVEHSDVFSAWVRNRAKLAYSELGPWLEGRTAVPMRVAAISNLAENLQLQWRGATQLRTCRHLRGALDFDKLETRPRFENGQLKEIVIEKRNAAKDLIEDLMIAANSATATFLTSKHFPSIRRVVRTPKQWDRIVALAVREGESLPEQPDPVSLSRFLAEVKKNKPERFPDLSLSVIKLLGPGEYVVDFPGQPSPGHFGLAVKDYTHSTAPNRRFPDLLTQRLLKAALIGQRLPYRNEELTALAAHCTAQEDAAKKVERQVAKSAAALLLQSRIGEIFSGLVTGSAPKGTWVRVSSPPVEGKLVEGCEGCQVGDGLRVRLVRTDVEHGLIDFEKI